MEDLFQSTTEEHPEPMEATIQGIIPDWIDGSLYRNGPAKFDFGGRTMNHLFDGMAMLHRFRISKGGVTYQNRYIQSDSYKKNVRSDRLVVSEYGTLSYPDPCKNIFQRISSVFHPVSTDNSFAQVFPLGDGLYTSSETPFLHRVDKETLATMDKIKLSDVVTLDTFSSHAHIENDGSIHNLGAINAFKTKHVVAKFTPPSETTDGDAPFCQQVALTAEVGARWPLFPAYIHSFGLTANYYILVEPPLVINVFKAFTKDVRKVPFAESIEYYPTCPTIFHIIDRKTGQKVNPQVQYEADTFVGFHHINAYEDGNELVVDVSAYTGNVLRTVKVSLMLKDLQSSHCEDHLRTVALPKPFRFVLPLNLLHVRSDVNLVTTKGTTATAVLHKNTMHCSLDVMSDLGLEFSQINYKRVNGQPYRYFYSVATTKDYVDAIVKLDIETRQKTIWREDRLFPSETIFVEAPDAVSEDDGVLLSVGLNTGPARCAYLLVIDAKTMVELGRASVDVQIPKDIHGKFLSGI